MEAVSRAYHGVHWRRGLVVGILPGVFLDGECRPPEGYPNPWVELPIRTHLPLSGRRGTEPLSRNHINVLSSDVIVALPGGPGTASEVALALRYRRPVIAYLGRSGTIDGLSLDGVSVARHLGEVQRFVRQSLPKS